MRKAIFLFSISLLTLNLNGQELVPGRIELKLDNELQSLAKGYAAAFDTLPAGPKYVVVGTKAEPEYLEGSVRDVVAVEAVVVISFERGPVIIMPASDIQKITNVRPQ